MTTFIPLRRAHLKRLLESAKVIKYMAQRHPEILSQFQSLVDLKQMVE